LQISLTIKGGKVTEDTRRNISNLKIDARLMRALAHPVRVQIVAELSKPGRVISPSEFAEQFRHSLSNTSYHFRALDKVGCIAIERERPVRGSTEHFYKASKKILFDSEEWGALPSIFKNGTAARALADYLNVARVAIEAGTFEARDDSHMSWATIRVDERGWCKVVEVMADALEKLLGVEAECAPRIAAGAEALDATFGLGAFESPPSDP
jgi:DNA-binding transcriptional ArsR family regulator